MSKLLLNEEPLLIMPGLAVKIGLNESIILQQFHYWLKINKRTNKNFKDNYHWTYNTYKEWQDQFPFWSISTIKRTVYKLEKLGLVISTDKFNKLQIDKTKWYRIDYEVLEAIENTPTCQNDTSIKNEDANTTCQNATSQNEPSIVSKRNVHRSKLNRALPETTTEINSKTIFKEVKEAYSQAIGKKLTPAENKILKEYIENYSLELILKAIHISVKRGIVNLKYIYSALEDWKMKGINTLEELETYLKNDNAAMKKGIENKRRNVKNTKEKKDSKNNTFWNGYENKKSADEYKEYIKDLQQSQQDDSEENDIDFQIKFDAWRNSRDKDI